MRDYQQPLFQAVVPQAFEWPAGHAIPVSVKRAVLVWHRRAGKDLCAISLLTMMAMEEVGNWMYMSPEISQTRKIIWNGIDKEGIKFIDRVPASLITRKLDQDMFIELINGSTLQLGGADAYDRLMGTNPKGIIFSEYSLMNPIAWNYFRPILAENGGIAIFIFTPRGYNHAYRLYQTAVDRVNKKDPRWFVSHLTADDTTRPDGSPVITQQAIQDEIDEGMPDDLVEQEFYCSFEAGVQGAYYAKQITKARKERRIGHYPHDPRFPVVTGWDVGFRDATAVWFAQAIEGRIRLIDYEEESGRALVDWCRVVLRKPYVYREHLGPHDLKKFEYGRGESLLSLASENGIEFTVVPKFGLQEGIEQVRAFIPRCEFDQERCEVGIDALASYQKVYDEKFKRYRDQPLHDWSSHGSDGFRYLVLGWSDAMSMDTVQTYGVKKAMNARMGRRARPQSPRSPTGRPSQRRLYTASGSIDQETEFEGTGDHYPVQRRKERKENS